MLKCLDLDFWDLELSSSRWVWLDHHRVNTPPPTHTHILWMKTFKMPNVLGFLKYETSGNIGLVVLSDNTDCCWVVTSPLIYASKKSLRRSSLSPTPQFWVSFVSFFFSTLRELQLFPVYKGIIWLLSHCYRQLFYRNIFSFRRLIGIVLSQTKNYIKLNSEVNKFHSLNKYLLSALFKN